MKNTKLAKAVAMAIAATSLSAVGTSGASASTTMYNTFQAYTVPTNTNPGTTDGWTWSDGPGKGTTPGATLMPWVGTTGGARPYGYTGSSALNWAANITQAGDSLQISQADSAKYGTTASPFYADIDTAGGAWKDATGKGWAHNTDIGLFKSDVTTDVTLKLSAINGPIANFGITVFTGMDTGTNYAHHSQAAGWNNPPAVPYTTSNPFGTDNVLYSSHLFGVTSTNGLTFTAQAGQIYSIYLGGYGGTGWNNQHDGYQLNISSVPVPAAVWLMGSGVLGLLTFGRRKKLAASAI